MATYITKIRTESGDLKIDYNALANLPKSDTTLSKSGSFADAKAVGDKVNTLSGTVNTLTGTVNNLKTATDGKAESEVYTGTFLTSGWSSSAPYTQTITISGILSTDTPIVDVNLSGVKDKATGVSLNSAWANVGRVFVSKKDNISAYCYETKPDVDIPIILKVVR